MNKGKKLQYLMASKAIAGAIYCIAHIILQILNLYGMIPMKYCVIVKLCETISLTYRNAWDPVVNQLAILLPDLLVCIAFLSWSWYESIPQPTGHLQHGFIAKKRESTVSWWLVVFNLALHMVFNIPKMGMVTRIIFKDEKKVSESEYYIWNLSTILYQVISPWLWIWTFRKFGKMYNKMNLSGTHLDSPWFRTEEDNRIAENTRDERARHMEDQKKEKKNNSRKKCSICCWRRTVTNTTTWRPTEEFSRIFTVIPH
ncbi:hypothetical protein L3Y34_002934 [Caenorhabditis briggsae]|uniref:Uncharacterized protein n=1 Tax=Caenorhabditis briggsae TaxID=6238 RepID=A0AAE9D2L4_CAEBR|nr:hypothetical protein L3Y34_002934 [Caenorhabditis briggsae]